MRLPSVFQFESQTSFASKFKTMIDDDRLFCDYFNPKDQTFCKRLQVLCPEHNKDQLAEDEVCGYPIQNQVFGKPVEFCRLSQKKCQQHSFWEKLRRAEIDMVRMRRILSGLVIVISLPLFLRERRVNFCESLETVYRVKFNATQLL